MKARAATSWAGRNVSGRGEMQAFVAVVADEGTEPHRFPGMLFARFRLQAYFMERQERLVGGLGKGLPESLLDARDIKAQPVP